ncbi:hypothetical protein CF326_g7904, partial [Tilletia indica]
MSQNQAPRPTQRASRGGVVGGRAAALAPTSGAISTQQQQQPIQPPPPPIQQHQQGLAVLQQSLAQHNTDMRTWVTAEVPNIVNKMLSDYHKAARSFTTHHNFVDIDNVQPSGMEDEHIVLVLNSLQLDDVQNVMRGQRDMKNELQKTREQLTSAHNKIRELEQKLQAMPAPQQTGPQSRRGTRRGGQSEDEGMGTDDEADEEITDLRSKRPKIGYGRPDAKIQDAFERLLRLKMGIEKEAAWPEYPSVDESSAEWPREVLELDSDHPEAAIDPQLRSNASLGPVLLRLDWINGRIDDAKFAEVLDDLAEELVEHADDHDLPDDAMKRTFDYVRNACKRTLTYIRRESRLEKQMGQEKWEKTKQVKKARDRRRGRQATRVAARNACCKLLGSPGYSPVWLAIAAGPANSTS